VVATPLDRDERPAVAAIPELPVVHLPPVDRRRPRWQRERSEQLHSRALVAAAVRRHGPFDLLWERHSLHSDGGWRWARRAGVPRLVEVNAPLALERARTDPVARPRLAERLEVASLRRAERVVVVSRWLRTWARSHGADPILVPQGTDVTPHGARASTRRRLGLSGTVLGFVGSHRPWHGLQRLHALLDALPHAHALVIGHGSAPPSPHPRITRIGPTSDLCDLLSACDVALAPGDAPPWVAPLKLADYRAAGLPIVASDVGDSRWMVGDAGEVLPVDASVDTWAAAIERQRGRRPPPHRVSWDDVVQPLLSLG
jgi:glycosyltransferase involved in cell wall biosynthesis